MPSIGASMATPACTSARTSPVWIGRLYGSAGGRPGLVVAVDQQSPDLLEGDPADDLLDVDAAVAQRGPFLVGLGDLGLERDDALEPVVYLSHGRHSALFVSIRIHRVRSHGQPPRLAAMGSAADTGPSADSADLAALRREYGDAGLDTPDLAPDPVAMFRRWMHDTIDAGLHEPNAMVVSTVSAEGRPSAADGAAQGCRRAWVRLLHQLRARARAPT